MQEIIINGLRLSYDRDRDLFNALLKMNGVSKKKFCEKFGLSYSYVNAWGSTTKEKEIKYPSWVFHYLRDVMYYKIEAIRVKMSLTRLYDELEGGKTLSELYIELYKQDTNLSELESMIPDDLLIDEKQRKLLL